MDSIDKFVFIFVFLAFVGLFVAIGRYIEKKFID